MTVFARMTLSLILSCYFVITTSQDVSPVQTYVGSYANFSFMLTEDPNTTLVNIKNKVGVIVMTAFDSVSVSNDPFYKDRVNFTGNTNQKLISFILRNVTLVDAGIYTAVLLFPNKTIGSQMLIVKASPSKPQIVELKGHAVNGTNYHLNCSAQSNSQPPNHNLSMFSEWRRDDMLINSSGRYIVNGTELTITSIIYKQDNGSTLTCVAFEDQLSKSVNSDKFIMDIKYGPENSVNLGSIPPTLGVDLNQTAPDITCNATCNPPCDYRWYQNGTFFRNGATLSLGIVEKTTGGNYRCEAYTSVLGVNRSSSTSVNIIVYFGAGIVNLSVIDYTVSENSSAIFQCHVDSNPPSTITWMKESNSAVLKTETGVVQSQYRIESAQCLNMDNYTCSAYNGIWTPAKATIPLFVRCHPRTDYRLSHETKIYRRRYEAAVLRYTVISYPLPTFNWTFLGNGSENRNLPLSVIQHNNGLQSELWFSSLGIDDFGNYSVIADNSLPPSAREVFEIILAAMTPDSSSTSSLPAVAGGIGAGVVVLLMAVIALFLWRRYQHRSQHTDGTQRNQINAKSVRHDAGNGQDYEGLHINNTEASAYLQLNDMTSEENREAKSRPPQNDSYETLHPCTNNDIQTYSSLKIPNISKDSEKVYENTRIKVTDLTAEHQ